MTPLLRKILDAGVTLETVGADRLHADGPMTDQLRSHIRENKPALLRELATAAHYRWRIIDPERGSIESCFAPEITHAEVMERHPGVRAWPIADSDALLEVAA